MKSTPICHSPFVANEGKCSHGVLHYERLHECSKWLCYKNLKKLEYFDKNKHFLGFNKKFLPHANE